MFDFVASLTPGMPNFLQVAGVKVTLNRQLKKATEILINDELLDDAKTYRVATSSYIAAGGDGFVMFKSGKEPLDTSTFMRDLLISFIQNQPEALTPKLDGRLTVISD